ncbi:hypothetical protein KOR42_13080 [Thalassoglobus neptunius]|uniref:Glycosyltransferase RgtA/B/C/D-like domain-containing protein n=1 Tax=Thalassoglobus neptunius TaxID=1938619 RepID=A0A5C5X4W1_9PLAN|nr:DUF2079 domain-containing protein [Thalassoglobus neptunius]TWT57940.1 hypothetical protein KOR42_13080 [Thalassoglobus neptunius]
MISQRAFFALLLQVVAVTIFVGFVLESSMASSAFFSESLRATIVESLGGTVAPVASNRDVSLNWLAVLLVGLMTSFVVNLSVACSGWIGTGGSRISLSEVFVKTVRWSWWLLAWSILWLVAFLSPLLTSLLIGFVNLAFGLFLAGWCYELLDRRKWSRTAIDEASGKSSQFRAMLFLVFGMILFTVISVGMNWCLWFNLRIPHGDSVMYEEHLWNVLHGKGFRSYLDQGLFWGEHIQFAHLFLLPVYALWPSHLLLELCETLLLASGAIPVYFITRRSSGDPKAACLMGLAYLLYFPMHFLDIAIDLKTFRPIVFGVPAMFWAILASESRRWKTMIGCFLFCLAAKEDYAIVIAPFGLWMACHEWVRSKRQNTPRDAARFWIGIATCVLATIYLLVVVKFAIPYFRGWETVHYARYFEAFGKTPTEIATNMLLNPKLLLGQLVTVGSVIYFLRLLVPLGMPLRAWSQLLVALPLFMLLCLNNLAMQPPGPYHHFHAPIVPILVWSAAVVVGADFARTGKGTMAKWIVSCSFATTLLFGFSPVSIHFWDPGHEMYWKSLYVQDDRAKAIEAILEQIPANARVASTDYVHVRLTHQERSYDYSDYPRKVANYEDRVPTDTDLIIIDRRHRYSIGVYDDISKLRELVAEPDEWELLPDETNGYFAVLKRKSSTIELK